MPKATMKVGVALVALALFYCAAVDAAAKAAKQWQPDEWACSPANTRNDYCPSNLQGDTRCTAEFCPALAGCATEDCHPFQGNIKPSKLIALDAYAVKGEKCIRQSFSVAECCSLCKSTKGCNAWSYCNSPDGCGSGCDPQKHAFSWYSLPQPWNDVDPAKHPSRLNPIHACTDDGAFPYGTCSLKYLEAQLLAAPPVHDGNQTSWISGLVSPGSVSSIDPVAFVLENDNSNKKDKDGAGGLLEEDRTAAPKAPEEFEVPVNKPSPASVNAAGAAGSSSSWKLVLGSCLVAVLVAAGLTSGGMS